MIVLERKGIPNWDKYLDNIKREGDCSFFSLPNGILVSQAIELYQKYLTLLKDNDFLIKETNRRIELLSHYPPYWYAIEAFSVEEIVCNQTKD